QWCFIDRKIGDTDQSNIRRYLHTALQVDDVARHQLSCVDLVSFPSSFNIRNILLRLDQFHEGSRSLSFLDQPHYYRYQKRKGDHSSINELLQCKSHQKSTDQNQRQRAFELSQD